MTSTVRKHIKGIIFYPMDVDHTTNKRIRLLFNDHNSDGYWIWSCIVAQAYWKEGYFHGASADDIDLLAADVCRKPPELIYRVVESCLRRGLFDRSVFEKANILTSDRMQINYIRGTYDRRRKGAKIYIPESHLLISDREIQNFGETQLTNVFCLETGKNLFTKIADSTEGTLFSTETPTNSTEKDFIPRKNDEIPCKKRKEDISSTSTNVLVVPDGTEASVDMSDSMNSEIKKAAAKGKEKKVAPKKEKVRADGKEKLQFMSMFVAIWTDFSFELYNQNNPDKKMTIDQFKKAFQPTPTDMSSMRQIIVATKAVCESAEHEWNQGYAKKAWRGFLGRAAKDKWLREHWLLKNLNENKNIILQNQSNGKGTTTHLSTNSQSSEKLGTSDSRVRAITKFGLAVPSGDKSN